MSNRFANHQVANIAMDIVVNQYINHDFLPGEPVLLENYKELNLEEHQDVGYYYHKLLQMYKSGEHSKAYQQLLSDLDKFPGKENEDGDKNGNEDENGNSNSNIGNHESWGKLSSVQAKVLDATINHTIKDTIKRSGKSIGNLPAGLQDYFKKLEEEQKPSVNWRRALRQFATTSQRTYLKNTIKRPSKRYGTVPGLKVRHRNRLLVAVDTSGSVSDEELNVFFGEMRHIYRQGAEILVVECDTDIQNTYLYKGKTPDFVMGRGGTSFDAPIDYANENYLPDAIIYFTDGEAYAPSNPARAPILWLISEQGIDENEWDFLPGIKIKMSK